MNARQYFYKNVLPKEVGISYQKAKNIKLSKKNRFDRKIWRHIPKLSNDRHVEDVAKNLLAEYIPKTFRNRLEHMFLTKLRSHEYSAAALIKPGEFRGDLIYYYVGLADCLFTFSIYFAEFTDNKMDHRIIQEHGLKIAIMAQDWRKTQPLTVDLDRNLAIESLDDEITNRAVGFATLTDKFVICHEIAHHLLGHTGKNNDANSLLDNLPEELKSWSNKSIQHSKELQADALAVLFMLRLTENTMVKGALNESQETFEAIFGCLLVLSVNKYLSNNPDEATSDYPSNDERLDSCLAIFSYFINQEFPEWVNAKLSIMFYYLEMLEEFSDLVNYEGSDSEIKSMLKKIKMLLLVRNGLKNET